MNSEKAPVTQKAKLAPEYVRECLSRDVHSILSVCLHQFNEEQEIDETCLNVDAVISGRSLQPKVRYEARVSPASWSSRSTLVGSDRPYATAGKGNFIPQSAFNRRFV